MHYPCGAGNKLLPVDKRVRLSYYIIFTIFFFPTGYCFWRFECCARGVYVQLLNIYATVINIFFYRTAYYNVNTAVFLPRYFNARAHIIIAGSLKIIIEALSKDPLHPILQVPFFYYCFRNL